MISNMTIVNRFQSAEKDYDLNWRLGGGFSLEEVDSQDFLLDKCAEKWGILIDGFVEECSPSLCAHCNLPNGDKAIIKLAHDKMSLNDEIYFYHKMQNKYDNVFTPRIIDTDKKNNILLLERIDNSEATFIYEHNLEEAFFTWKAITVFEIMKEDISILRALTTLLQLKANDTVNNTLNKVVVSGVDDDSTVHRLAIVDKALVKGLELENSSYVKTMLHGDLKPQNTLDWRFINPVTSYGDQFYDLASWLANSLTDEKLYGGAEQVHDLIAKLSKLYVKNIVNNTDFTEECLVHNRLFDWVCVIAILQLQNDASYSKLLSIAEAEF